MNQAARATSAAPTYFPVQKIRDRYFVDGGIDYNNPSEAIYDHYTELVRKPEGRRPSTVLRHGHLDFKRARFINLGTGARPTEPQPPQQARSMQLIPGAIRMALWLKRTLLAVAVNSEKTAKNMGRVAQLSCNTEGLQFLFERFSADNGVCFVQLDDYKALDYITDLTQKYLRKADVAQKLQSLGQEMATEYLQKRGLDQEE